MDSFYEISRGYRPGKPLTVAQKMSSLFSEEPVVLGKVLRANTPPLRLSEAQYKANRVSLTRLEKAGAIRIKSPTLAAPVEAPEGLGEAVGKAIKEELALDEGLESSPPVAPPEPSKEEEVTPAVEDEAKLDARPGKKGKKG